MFGSTKGDVYFNSHFNHFGWVLPFCHCCSFVWPRQEVHLILVKQEREVSGKNFFGKTLAVEMFSF